MKRRLAWGLLAAEALLLLSVCLFVLVPGGRALSYSSFPEGVRYADRGETAAAPISLGRSMSAFERCAPSSERSAPICLAARLLLFFVLIRLCLARENWRGLISLCAKEISRCRGLHAPPSLL